MTKEERHLWYDFLKKLPFDVYRQKPIGRYIVDFYLPQKKTVIELDGSQHYEDIGRITDLERDAFLSEYGLTVIRYSNLQINTQFSSVCEDLLEKLGIEL